MNLLIHGVPDNGETNDICLSFRPEDLDIEFNTHVQYSHHVGPKKTTNMRLYKLPSIIFTLNDFDKSEEMYNATALIEVTIVMTENLIQKRCKIIEDVNRKFGRENVWSSGGHVTKKEKTIG